MLCRRPGEPRWLFVGTAAVGADGRWSLPIAPVETYDHWVFHRPETGTDPSTAVAGPVRVTATVRVAARTDRTSGRVGTTFEIGTVVGPVSAGRPVRLQQRVDGGWKTVETRKLRAQGPTWFKVTPTRGGGYAYRVYRPGRPGIADGTSRTVRIKVGGGA